MTRSRVKKRAAPQQTAMSEAGEQRRIVIHYCGSDTAIGAHTTSNCVMHAMCSDELRQFNSSPFLFQSIASISTGESAAVTGSEVPSEWGSKALKLTHPRTGTISSRQRQLPSEDAKAIDEQ